MSFEVHSIYPFKDHVPDFYQTRHIDTQFVADGLREEVNHWTPRDAVMIDAPTGSGKNTFILNECIPRAVQAGKNILIISNRIALSTQQKLLIMRAIESPLLGRLTDQGILDEETFGNVKVITYHRLRTFFEDASNNEWCQKLLFVIMDESHFFVADSLFNELCGYYLEEIVRRFTRAIRIYMTATSWDVLYPIADAEKRNYHEFVKPAYWQPPRAILRYYFPRNFKNYNLNFINDIDELPALIGSDSKNKWLIFIDNRDKGKALASKLGDKCDYIDAESKGSNAWKSIIANNRFEKQVLVSTSVLDNGVNISDTALKNIAIFTESRTSLIQMLGRKRCADSETVNLWVCDIPQSKAAKHYNDYKYLYSWFEAYDNCHTDSDFYKLTSMIWYSDNPKLRKLFSLGKGKLYENKMARFSIERKLDFLGQIVDGKTTFQTVVQQWLGKPVEQPQRYVDKLTSFCKENFGKYLSDSQCQVLRSLIVNSYEEKGHKEPHRSRVNELKERSLNNRLFAIGLDYQIENVKNQWILRNSGEEDDLDIS